MISRMQSLGAWTLPPLLVVVVCRRGEARAKVNKKEMNQFDSYASDGLRAFGCAGGYLRGTRTRTRSFCTHAQPDLVLGWSCDSSFCLVVLASPRFFLCFTAASPCLRNACACACARAKWD